MIGLSIYGTSSRVVKIIELNLSLAHKHTLQKKWGFNCFHLVVTPVKHMCVCVGGRRVLSWEI